MIPMFSGLASVGTVCRPDHNSGFVTLLNFGQERSMEESILTFAHEVAHNFNAAHDNDFEDESCSGQGFIMEELYNGTSKDKQGQFSPCSIRSMTDKLNELSPTEFDSCFRPDNYVADATPEVALCGNGVVEPGEECDCGHNRTVCNDPCCYPAIIPRDERLSNQSFALPCSRNSRPSCLMRSGMIYGFYLPWAFILVSVIALALVLYRDWHGKRECFKHLSSQQIRIVNHR